MSINLAEMKIIWTNSGMELEVTSIKPDDFKKALQPHIDDEGYIKELMEIYQYAYEQMKEAQNSLERHFIND